MGFRDRHPNWKSRPLAQNEDAEPSAKILMSFVACARDMKMLGNAPVAGLVKLRCGIVAECGRF